MKLLLVHVDIYVRALRYYISKIEHLKEDEDLKQANELVIKDLDFNIIYLKEMLGKLESQKSQNTISDNMPLFKQATNEYYDHLEKSKATLIKKVDAKWTFKIDNVNDELELMEELRK